MHEDVALKADAAISMPPDDEHNARLIANTHPSDWRNPAPQNPYNLWSSGLAQPASSRPLARRVWAPEWP